MESLSRWLDDGMARYITTIPSSKSPAEAFAYMADLRNFAEWDKGIIRVEQITGDGAGIGTDFDITIKGFGGQNSVLRYETTEFDSPTNVLVKGKNWMFTSIDRVTVTPTATGCDVTYDDTFHAVQSRNNIRRQFRAGHINTAAAMPIGCTTNLRQ